MYVTRDVVFHEIVPYCRPTRSLQGERNDEANSHIPNIEVFETPDQNEGTNEVGNNDEGRATTVDDSTTADTAEPNTTAAESNTADVFVAEPNTTTTVEPDIADVGVSTNSVPRNH